jgi:hypothetical protein
LDFESNDEKLQPANEPTFTEESDQTLSPGLSVSLLNHPELQDLIRAWPSLPEALRAGIIAMVKTAK